jgi:hypothetical protein
MDSISVSTAWMAEAATRRLNREGYRLNLDRLRAATDPLQLLIAHRDQASQFAAVFTDWDFAPRIAKSVFTPDLPLGTEEIPFAPVVAGANPQ